MRFGAGAAGTGIERSLRAFSAFSDVETALTGIRTAANQGPQWNNDDVFLIRSHPSLQSEWDVVDTHGRTDARLTVE
jgi:hypothetical protein